MKKNDIKRHLQDYQISKRASTISHAFASALSLADEYNLDKIDAAIKILGQNPDSELECAYCDAPAETWDHIKAVVEKTVFSGNGHQINNLLPCCKSCNSSKGNKHWEVFLNQKGTGSIERVSRIKAYINNQSININELMQTHCLDELKEFYEIKSQVFELFKLADHKAKDIRDKLRNHLETKQS